MRNTKEDQELLAAMTELMKVYQDVVKITESQIRDIKALHSKGMDLIDKLTQG